jgi:hypothetical protein
MRRWLLVPFVSALGLVGACESSSAPDQGPGAEGIHPQPQPNRKEATFTAPCTATSCGITPGELAKPVCKPASSQCTWSESEVTSYRPCAESECGVTPGTDVCAPGTEFKTNMCGSENEGACLWRTVCAPPPSTTPCSAPDGCGEMPLIGVLCQDGGTGELACMQFASECRWQATCP